MREIHAYRLGALIRACFPSTWRPDAITIGHTVIYWIPPTEQTRRHEQQHVFQAMQLGRLRFWARYIREYLRVGYWDNAFERDARRAAGEKV